MANKDIMEDLVIKISTEFDGSDLAKAQKALSNFSEASVKTVSKTNQSFSTIKNEYALVAKSFDLTNKTVASAYQKYNASVVNAEKARNAYKASTNRVSTAQTRLDAVKSNTKLSLTSGNMTSKQMSDSLSRINLAKNSLDNAKLSKKNYFISYQQAVIKAKSSIDKLIASQRRLNAESSQEVQTKQRQIQKLQEEATAREEAKKSALDYVNKLKKSFSNFKKKFSLINFGKLIAIGYTVRYFVRSLNSLFEASSSWIENLNLLEVTFADTSEAAKKFVDTTANNLGLDKNAIAEYVSTFKQMANAMGQVSETGTMMSEALTKIALDIASLRNVDIDTAVSDLTSAIAGQVKPVRKYGFDITMYSIDELMKEQGYGAISRQMTQAQKQLARTILLIRQSQDAWGDLSKTINTFANQTRVAKDQLTNLKRIIGNIAIGTFTVGQSFEEASKTAGFATKTLWYLNGVMMATSDILKLFIPEIETFNTTNAVNQTKQYADELEDAEDSMNGMLAGFDKFNSLSDGQEDNESISSMLNSVLASEYSKLEEAESVYSNINQYARQIADNILKWVFPNFKNFSGTFAEFLSGKNVMDEFNTTILGVINLFSALEALFESFKPIAQDLFNFFIALMNAIIPIVNFILNAINSLGVNNVLYTTLTLLLAIKGVKITLGIVDAITKLKPLIASIYATNKALLTTNSTLNASKIGMLGIYAIAGLLVGQFLTKLTKEARGAIGVLFILGTTLIFVAKALGATLSIATAGLGIAMAIAGIYAISSAITESTGGGNLSLFADGGYQTGGMFYAGEKGNEWVGRQGRTSTIINDGQMSDIMMSAVAEGVVVGNQAIGGNKSDDRPINVYVGATKLFEITKETAKRQGVGFAKLN